MDEVYLDRLRTLADFLETVPPERFNLRGWYRELSDCGAVACAVGWACTIPEFRAAGLRLVKGAFAGLWCPAFDGLKDWEAVRAFFGVTEEESEYLFVSCFYDRGDVEEVAARLRQFADSKSPPTEFVIVPEFEEACA